MTDRTVLEHLLEGRDALLAEISRLTTAVAELDSVIARLGGGTPGTTPQAAAPALETPAAAPARREAPRRPARKAAARQSTRTTRTSRAAAAPRGDTGGKSIREHVLDMLGAEQRDFGLAEIIDRIHGLGIQAHDDAVRSITIKLMKDGQVERVGRGQYRLTRTGATSAAGSTDSSAAASAPTAAAQSPASSTPTAQPGGSQVDGAPSAPAQGGYVPPMNFDSDPGTA